MKSRLASRLWLPAVAVVLAGCIAEISGTHQGEGGEASLYGLGSGTVRFVAPSGRGRETGENVANAANWLDQSFWDSIRSEQRRQAVTVLFVDGRYVVPWQPKEQSTDFFSTWTGVTFEDFGGKELTLQGLSPTGASFFSPSGGVIMRFLRANHITLRNLHFRGSGAGHCPGQW